MPSAQNCAVLNVDFVECDDIRVDLIVEFLINWANFETAKCLIKFSDECVFKLCSTHFSEWGQFLIFTLYAVL